MNKLLELKGPFNYNQNNASFGPISLPQSAKNHPITLEHLIDLRKQLIAISHFWMCNTLINGALTTVYYREIVFNSNRLGKLLKERKSELNDNICGAKFNKQSTKHIFTYFNSIESINDSIELLNNAINITDKYFDGKVTKEDIDNIKERPIDVSQISKSAFSQIIKDAFFVEKFTINKAEDNIYSASIISLYQTGTDTKTILEKLGINMIDDKMLDNTTIRLTPDEFEILKAKAPYLIAMNTVDLSSLKTEELIEGIESQSFSISSPKDEPIIGVIDQLFDDKVYFHEWVENVNMVNDDLYDKNDKSNYFHGTAVTSIIVDGPQLNPKLDDGCGHFRVKHFGVACGTHFSTFSILKSIRMAIYQNQTIKVWNLSLGSTLEINPNFISPEAAELDRIQSDYDVIFVVAGTNKPKNIDSEMKVGSPADSINSIVVNSVNFKKEAASYHRTGPVLSFFYKPDVSYYGGDKDEKIRVCSNYGESYVSGTSFAAPWIARKMAYLIEVLGFDRMVAKALLIDSAADWNSKDTDLCDIGYGVVPINIKDIVGSKNDEIKFIISNKTEEYETYAFNIPIPLNKEDKYPYNSRATLCYYPQCSRNQGVDYTDTEIDFQFGRVGKNKNNSFVLKSFNGNKQGESNALVKEVLARSIWRKWDNVKHIADRNNQRTRSVKSYNGAVCGVKLTVKRRLSSKHITIPFGIVITLKDIEGKNRISDFIKNCQLKGWYVSPIDIEKKIDIKNKAEEEIIFECSLT